MVFGRDVGEDEVHAFRIERAVCVGYAGLFEGETNVFATAGEAGPVNQLVGSVVFFAFFAGLLTFGGGLR